MDFSNGLSLSGTTLAMKSYFTHINLWCHHLHKVNPTYMSRGIPIQGVVWPSLS